MTKEEMREISLKWMKYKVQECLDHSFDKGWEEGYESGIKQIKVNHRTEVDDAYKKGLSDAWEVAREISVMPYETQTEVFNECGNSNVFGVYTASEAKEKIEAWEEKQTKKQDSEKIMVGDEIKLKNSGDYKAIVTRLQDQSMFIVWDDGSSGRYSIQNTNFVKTGRHYDIRSILEQMQENE